MAGDVILFHGTSVVARLIRLFDGTEWNHCGHLIDTDLLAEIDAGVPAGTKKLSEKLASYGTKGESYAGVFRLKSSLDGTITSMQPLADSTGAIIARAPSYGYDAIILLFLLSISKKVPSIPWWGRTLITLVGRRAADMRTIPDMAEIEKAGTDFLKRAGGRKPVRPPRAAAVLADNPELASAIETALQFFPAVGLGARAAALIGGVDRLISPGDLSASASLKQVGRLDADGTFTSV